MRAKSHDAEGKAPALELWEPDERESLGTLNVVWVGVSRARGEVGIQEEEVEVQQADRGMGMRAVISANAVNLEV